jgi:hypothetical protein
MTISTPARHWFALFILSVIPAFAANRVLMISAPAAVRPGAPVHVMVTASTDANDGEDIGFFHSEYSVDGGRTWLPVYAEKVGASATRPVDFKAGADGTRMLVRSRMAFRGGKAGDVDYTGGRILWDDTWARWATPPAKVVTIVVTAQ